MEIGKITTGTVTGIMPFGAFVLLADGKTTGLVHISEIAQGYVSKVENHLKKGDKVTVKILKVDEKGKLSLSIKKALSETASPAENKKTPKHSNTGASQKIRPAEVDFAFGKSSNDMSFEDKLSLFKKASDEKMQALKKSNDSKRSGGYKRGR